MSIVLLTLSAAVALASATVFIWAVHLYGLALHSRRWPTTDGVVVASAAVQESAYVNEASLNRAIPHRVWYRTTVSYEYRVGGKLYLSRRLSFSDHFARWFGWERSGIRVGRYSRGAVVTVHYDPARPGMAVLQPGVWAEHYVALVWCLVVFGITFSSCLLLLRQNAG